MEQIFISILNRSLTAAYCAVIVLCIRMCIRRLPKVYSYVLWLVVFVRLAVPFSLESVYSIVRVSSSPVPADIGMEQTPHIATGIGQLDYTANRILAWSLPQTDAAASVNPMQVVLSAASWIWLTVSAALTAYWVVSYLALKHRLKDAAWTEGDVWMTDKIPVPFVMGILKPCIYLPPGLSEKERACVISHEQVHVRRRDYLVKQLAYVIVCVHWFNPMAWLSLWLMCRDMELSCDEAVLKHSGLDGEQRLLYKKEYAAVLLTLAGGRKVRLSGPLFFGTKNVKGRIQNVLSYRKYGKFVTCVSVVLILLATVGLMGNRKVSWSEDPYISVTIYRYDAGSNTIKSSYDIVQKGVPAFQELDGLLAAHCDKVVFHSLKAGNDFLNGAGECIVIRRDNREGFCVRGNGSAALCKADGSVYEYRLKDGKQLFQEIEDLLKVYGIEVRTVTGASMIKGEICARLKADGYSDVCWIPEEYWAGIEGIDSREQAYPIIAASDRVWEDESKNRNAVSAAVYCLTEDGLKEVGTLESSSTAMPLCYDKTGIYCGSHQMGNRCIINTETWEWEIAEWVSVDYYEDPEGTYYYGLGDAVRESAEEEWDAFWNRKFLAAVLMHFEELP